jgi:hypothetical protein
MKGSAFFSLVAFFVSDEAEYSTGQATNGIGGL